MDWSKLPPLASLRAFEAAARHCSHSAAARELGVTHAAVAQQVRALEGHLGQQLLTRAGRGLALTPEGAMLAKATTDGFGQIARCLSQIDDHAADRSLFLTMTPTFALIWLLPRMHRFREAHPEIELSVNPTVEKLDIAASRMDAAIRFGAGPWRGLDAEMLIPTDFVVVGAPALIEKYRIERAEDLLALPWIQEAGLSEVTTWMDRIGLNASPPAKISELPGYMMISSLREGHGIGAVVRLLIEDDIANGHLVILSDGPGTMPDGLPDGYQLLTRPGTMRAPLKTFVRWLRREAAASNPQRVEPATDDAGADNQAR